MYRGSHNKTISLIIILSLIQIINLPLTLTYSVASDSKSSTSPQAGNDDPCKDSSGSNHCDMKNIAIAGAVAQGTEMLAFTTAGYIGTKACSAQDASLKADEAADSSLQAVETKEKHIQTEAGNVTTAGGAVHTTATNLGAALEELDVSKTNIQDWSTKTIAAAEIAITDSSGCVSKSNSKETLQTTTKDLQENSKQYIEAAEKVAMVSNKTDGVLASENVVQGGIKSTSEQARALHIFIDEGRKSFNAAKDLPKSNSKEERAQAVEWGSKIADQKDNIRDSTNMLKKDVNKLHTKARELSKTTNDDLMKSSKDLLSSFESFSRAVQNHQRTLSSLIQERCPPKNNNPSAQQCCNVANKAKTSTEDVSNKIEDGRIDLLAIKSKIPTLSQSVNTFSETVEELDSPADRLDSYSSEKEFGALAIDYDKKGKIAQQARIHREESTKIYKIAEGLAIGADIAGSIAVIAATGAIAKKVEAQSITQAAVPIVMDIAHIGKDVAEGKKLSCPGTYSMNFLQALIRGGNMAISIYTAVQEANFHKEETGNQATFGAHSKSPGKIENGSSSTESGQTTATVDPSMLRDLPAADQEKLSPKALATSLATAQDKEALPKLLHATTGLTPEHIAQQILNGHSPMQAAATSIPDLGPTELASLSALEANKDEVLALTKPELEKIAPSKKPQEYALESSSRRRSPASSDNAGIDVNALLSQILKKPEPAGAPGTKMLSVSAGQIKAPSSSDGFHSADKSLFDVVDARYRSVSYRLLGGDAPASSADMPSAQQLLPENPYLRRKR